MKLKIEYLSNTCNHDEFSEYGEIMVLLKDGVPVAHHDYSDGSLELEYVSHILAPYGIDIEFVECKETQAMLAKIGKYLKAQF